MTHTFRGDELRVQRQANVRRRQARRIRQVDPFCQYLLGVLDEEGEHSRSAEPEDKAYRLAKRIMVEG